MRTLLEFHRSPNSVKVRVALGFKGLEYEIREMMAADRAPMMEAAGWPLVPILLDGDVAMRDSAAILHYLEANYRDAPSLTPASRDDIRSAEALLARLNPEILSIQYGLEDEIRKSDSERDEGRIATGRATLVAALERLERRLATVPWLVGGAMSLYDVILACNLLPARPPARFVEQSPLWRFFADHLALDGDRPAIEAWVDRVIAHDAKL
ncbi:MAG TPA: glutathione S-transferase family protein [Gemmatimonadota bacterium]|jgi:glutathione S-transferase|nr:glutathione S-transferase family protein [Gemmatimonadota bacterium]